MSWLELGTKCILWVQWSRTMSYMIIFTAHKDHDVVTQYILRHLAGLFVALPQKVKMPVGGRRGCCSLQSNGNNLYSVTGPAAGLNLAWGNVKEIDGWCTWVCVKTQRSVWWLRVWIWEAVVLCSCFSVPLLELGGLHPIQKTRQLTDNLLPLVESFQPQHLTAETLHNCKNTLLV